MLAAIPTYTIVWDWRDALFDLIGLCCIIGGTLLVLVAHGQAERQSPPSLLVGMCAVCAGVDLLYDDSAHGALWMTVFLAAIGMPLWGWRKASARTPDWRTALSEWRKDATRYAVRRGALLCGVVALALGIEMFQVAYATGGPKAHALELGTIGVLLAIVGVAWAAATDSIQVFIRRGQPIHSPSPAIGSNLVGLSLALFGVFVLLSLAIQIPLIQDLDVAFARLAYRCWNSQATQLLRRISNAGGRDLATLWIPAILALLVLVGRGRALRFFIAVMFGTLGLETVFKVLSHRLRPEFTRGTHFDSFPSGHALAATILAGLLLVLFLPTYRYRWQRVSLWIGAVTWPLLMAFSRVYTGRHYLTDVLGALMLGTAWVCLCTGLCLWLNEIGFGTRQPQPARGDGLAKRSDCAAVFLSTHSGCVACPTSRHPPDCGQRKRCGS